MIDRLNNLSPVVMRLAHFADAEPIPRILEPFDWDQSSSFFVRGCRTVGLPAKRA